MSALLALLASGLWGVSDFLGGTLSRRLPALVVLAGGQLTALVVLVPVALLMGGFSRPLDYLPYAVAAGLAGTIALAAFYRALAVGTMGVVAPIAALGIVVPVTAGLVSGEEPSPWQLAGIVAAVVGVVLASGPELRGGPAPQSIALAAVAAVGFGVVLVLLAEGGETSVVMTLLAMRATAVLTLGVGLVALRRLVPVTRRDAPGIAAIGLGDVGANAAYTVATQSGLVSVSAVLASLYPVVTVLLARELHHERLRPVQTAGVVAALGGVVLLAAG